MFSYFWDTFYDYFFIEFSFIKFLLKFILKFQKSLEFRKKGIEFELLKLDCDNLNS